MKPVVTALHAIAAIERETREAQEAASAGRFETILSQDLSESSLVFGNDRPGPDEPSACNQGTAHLNRGLGTPPMAHLEATAREAACAWDGKIRIEKQDRIVVTPARNITAIVTGALLSALALFIGWTGGLNSDLFTLKPASLTVKKPGFTCQQGFRGMRSECLGASGRETP
jgi:hypothetical protein